MRLRGSVVCRVFSIASGFLATASSFATTKGLNQIVTPDLQGEGDFSLSLQIQDKRIGNPYEIQNELGLTKWLEVAVFNHLPAPFTCHLIALANH
jgi:hypothetical protein